MPDGTDGVDCGDVMILSAEDVTTRPPGWRIEAIGGDVDRVHVLDPDDVYLASFPEDTDDLEALIRRVARSW